jgi:hypothetical protein
MSVRLQTTMKRLTHSITNTRVSILRNLLDFESLIQRLRVLKTKLSDRRLSKRNTEEEILIISSNIFAFKGTILDSHSRCLSSKDTFGKKGNRSGQFQERRHSEKKAWRDTPQVSELSDQWNSTLFIYSHGLGKKQGHGLPIDQSSG